MFIHIMLWSSGHTLAWSVLSQDHVILLGLCHAPVICRYDEVASCTSTHGPSWRKFQDLWAVIMMWWTPYVLDRLKLIGAFHSCVAALDRGPRATGSWTYVRQVWALSLLSCKGASELTPIGDWIVPTILHGDHVGIRWIHHAMNANWTHRR